jgi:hypothetical protein
MEVLGLSQLAFRASDLSKGIKPMPLRIIYATAAGSNSKLAQRAAADRRGSGNGSGKSGRGESSAEGLFAALCVEEDGEYGSGTDSSGSGVNRSIWGFLFGSGGNPQSSLREVDEFGREMRNEKVHEISDIYLIFR